MSAAVAVFPTLQPAPYASKDLCDFSLVGYHQERLAAPGETFVFWPVNAGYYDDWRTRFDLQAAVRSSLSEPGSNVVPFKPRALTLKVVFEATRWEVWGFYTDGQRVPLTGDMLCGDWAHQALEGVLAELQRQTGRRFYAIPRNS